MLGLLLWLTPAGRGLIHLSYDLPFSLRVDTYADEAVIVQMDEASRRELLQSSMDHWNRDLHAQFVEKMTEWKARAVIFDLPFTQSSTNDRRFLQAVAGCGKVAVAVSCPPSGPARKPNAVIRPFAGLQRVARSGVALSDGQPDIIRLHEGQIEGVAPLSQTVAQMVLGHEPASSRAPRWINYYGPPGVFSSFSYADVLGDRLPAEVFSNKVVFIGPAGFTNGHLEAGLFRTPYTPWRHVQSTGVEIEATCFLNLMRGDWLTRLPSFPEFLVLALLGGCFGWGLGYFQPFRAAGVALLGAAGVMAVALWLMWHQRIWFAWMIVVAAQIPAALAWSVISLTRRLSRSVRDLEEALAPDESDEPPTPKPEAPLPMPEPGQPALPSIPNHRLIRCIGRGAYGEVWLARADIGVFHAVKLVFRNHFKDKNPFEREYRGILQYTPLSRTHHGLVQILDIGRDPAAGYFFYVMELADCETMGRHIDPAKYAPRNLARELERRGLLPVAECVRLGLELAEALGYLHSRQLVHRDIKPPNIIFVNNVPKLADVGLVTHFAEARRDDKKLGTEGFVPPEGPGTPSADVYSLGKVLCEAALGLEAALASTPPSIPPDRAAEPGLAGLIEIIGKACHDDPARRYQSSREMQEDLMGLNDGMSDR